MDVKSSENSEKLKDVEFVQLTIYTIERRSKKQKFTDEREAQK